MKRLATLALAACLLALAAAAPARAEFGLHDYDVVFTEADGTSASEAGTHPHAMRTSFGVNSHPTGPETALPDGALRDLIARQVAGFVGDTTAYETCSTLQFVQGTGQDTQCPLASAVGVTANAISLPGFDKPNDWVGSPVYTLAPPPGVLLRLGFKTTYFATTIDVGISQSPPHVAVASLRNVPQVASVYGSIFELWGDPSDPSHDELRGRCYGELAELGPGEEFEFSPEPIAIAANGPCGVQENPRPFLTLPASCTGPAPSSYQARSWAGERDADTVLTHDQFGEPQGFQRCDVPSERFDPTVAARTSTDNAASGSGLEFSISFDDQGLTSIDGTAQSQIKEAVTVLPEGMTVNPSIAEGLGSCSPGDYEREEIGAAPGEGCPEDSKIGTVEVESPLVQGTIDGSLYVAQQEENPFDSLIALYIVIKEPRLGLLVKIPLKVEPDPRTGQLITTATDLPQLPFSSFTLRFREGQRAPLITPPECGRHTVAVEFRPWSDPGEEHPERASFALNGGPADAPCPAGGAPPFAPGFAAGSLSNHAGSHSPFAMRLTRQDGEQDMTKFSAVLPPGLVGKLAGLTWCPEARIARAPTRSGRDELAAPSCPVSSQIGRTEAGAGVGSALTYVPGALYLAGPHNGAPLSVVAITPAVAGPFDAGTVAVRVALRLNPVSGEVEADGARSDPIPHILRGIPLKLRDLRIHADRPAFTLNPTSCEPSSTRATLFGSFLDLIDPADDVPVGLGARYQAAGCRGLGFKPRLGLRLKGGTRRGAFPALRAVYAPRAGDANLRRLALAFPRSAFIEQGHFRTICTRVQFAAGPGHGAACPKGSIYGRARVWTPLLDAPLQGPVYLRSSTNNLPDAVFALRGVVEIEVTVRIDSVRGRLRATVQGAPDAPVSRAVVQMQGGQKGLFVNSRHLCRKPGRNRARVNLKGQNGRKSLMRPVVRASGCKKGKGRRGAARSK